MEYFTTNLKKNTYEYNTKQNRLEVAIIKMAQSWTEEKADKILTLEEVKNHLLFSSIFANKVLKELKISNYENR